MPSLRDIKRRIGGVRSTAQITKAMELVAASRMRRAQQRVLGGPRPYAETMRTFIGELAAAAGGGGDVLHPLLAQREVDTVGIILLTTDRGLCGALNTNTIRRASELILEQTQAVELLTIGRKGQDFMAAARLQDLRVRDRARGSAVRYEQVIPDRAKPSWKATWRGGWTSAISSIRASFRRLASGQRCSRSSRSSRRRKRISRRSRSTTSSSQTRARSWSSF